MDKHREAYREEACELLSELESTLLELEETPDDEELIGRAFRAMHTIKGSGAMFGFDDIAAFTHEIETVFDLVREGGIPVTRGLMGLTLSACDQIKKMVDGDQTDEAAKRKILNAFQHILSDTVQTGNGVSEAKSSKRDKPECRNPSSDGNLQGRTTDGEIFQDGSKIQDTTYRIGFRPAPDIFSTGANPILLLDELRALGDCTVIVRRDALPELKDLDPEASYLYWDVILTTRLGINAVKDVFIFVEDECELHIEVIDEDAGPDGEAGIKRLGEILVDRGYLSSVELKGVMADKKRIGEVLVEADMVDRGAVESALVEQRHVKQVHRKRQEAALASSIRVAADKLDILVDLVGELVTVQASLSQKASLQNDSELLRIAEEVERLTGDLRDNTMSIRMLPIGTTFSKFKRLVRDLSNELGKEVVMITDGGETELDKTVIERLNDPMVHIIRNCIDHGLEGPDIREAAGKPRQGTVRLSAVHSGANVVIRISDDGAGLDAEAIRAQAVKRGVIAPDVDLSEDELYAQILAPGFSTANKITDVSGRGVGMDVVKRSIDALRGAIEIASQKGMGTTISLRLPLTLAIIDGLLVEIGPSCFVLPLSAVEECVELTREDMAKARGRHMVNVRDELIPYILLRELFGMEEEPPAIAHIVIAEVDGRRLGFVVDRVTGEHQTVIKNLGRVYRDAKGFSGATILADGTVALILDVNRLTETAEVEEHAFISRKAKGGA